MKASGFRTQAKDFINSIMGKSAQDKPPAKKTSKSEPVSPPSSDEETRSFSWLKLFTFSVTGLILLGLGIMAVNTVESLFARHNILGFIGLGLFGMTILALLVMSGRELLALIKLRRVTQLRQKGEKALSEENDQLRNEVISQTHGLYVKRSDLSEAFDKLSEQGFDRLSPEDRFTSFEMQVMLPLDTRARHVISDTAKRVSMLTAVSPIAALDVTFVCWQNLRMLHKLASIYSGRPGSVETLKLAKMVLSHLALTGGIAMGDNLLQNLLGRGLAAKVSTRLGEGLANGILTSRVGLAALDLCRPLPFHAVKKPSLKNLIGPLISIKSEENLAA